MATVFYSWQADHPTDTGRNLVERALREAIKALNSDAEIEEAERDDVRLDRDTLDVPGSPPIMQTIFAKVDVASAFVADLTFVAARTDGRLMPNPNVTLEYGYALRALTHASVIGVMNTAFGDLDDNPLPFDLGHLRRPITYDCPSDATEEERKQVRKALAGTFKVALKLIFDKAPRAAVAEPPAFVRLEPLDGRARFRKGSEPIGELHGGLPMLDDDGDPRVFLEPGPAMWLRVMPALALHTELRNTQIQDAMQAQGVRAVPLNLHNETFSSHGVRGPDGFGLCSRVHDAMTRALIYGFKRGELWTIDSRPCKSPATRMNARDAG